jgi:hypothetical protein
MKTANLFVLLVAMVLFSAGSLFPHPQGRDVPAELEQARRQLHGAHESLEHAGGEWGGHKVSAMNHIEAALKELEEAERYAHEHHDVR